MQTFYWYDYETFGKDRLRDRPAQFAGRRTAMDLSDLDEGEMFYAKPPRDVLPDPESVLLTGITPQACEEKGLVESDFAREVYERMNEPGTVSIGYNSLGFDDEINRFLFWRNFLDPYRHSWQAGCSRWDLLPVVVALWALQAEDRLAWPLREDGTPSFKLPDLSRANHLVHEHAHDALSDVEATIGLARLLREREPRLWAWAFENRGKEKVREALGKGPVVWVSLRLGRTKACTAVVKELFSDGNESIVWDLGEDPAMLEKLSMDEIRRRLLVSPKSLPEGESPLPVHRIKTNASPFICSALGVMKPGSRAAKGSGVSIPEARVRAKRLDDVPREVIERMRSVLEERKAARSERAPDVDFGLYAGSFPSSRDKGRFAKIRRTDPAALAHWTEAFDDPRFEELLFRYRARSWPETLKPEEFRKWKSFCAARLIGGACGMRTVGDYMEKIDDLRTLPANQAKDREALLDALEDWGLRLGDWAEEQPEEPEEAF